MKQVSQISSTQLIGLYRQALKKNLSLDKLEKKISKKLDKVRVSNKVEQKEEKERVTKIRRRLPKKIRYGALVLPIVFIGVGLFLLGNAITPLAQYYISSLPDLSQQQLKTPIPGGERHDHNPKDHPVRSLLVPRLPSTLHVKESTRS